MTAAHQLVPVFTHGDAISGAVAVTRDELRLRGFESEIFAALGDRDARAPWHDAGELSERLRPGDTVIYHLSIGSPLAREFVEMDARRVVVFHNITPQRYFTDTSPRVSYLVSEGHDDLELLRDHVDLWIADSTYNRHCLGGEESDAAVVIPPPVDLRRLDPRPAAAARPQLLFVGRLAPNKRPDHLLRMLAVLRAVHEPQARLRIVGGSDDTEPYRLALVDLAEQLEISDAVEFSPGRIRDHELGAAYAEAALFVTASEHEGYCVPLVEAMAFDLPSLASSVGAIPETAAGSALLLDDWDPVVWAAAAARLLGDAELRSRLQHRGQARLEQLSPTVIGEQLASALASIGVTP